MYCTVAVAQPISKLFLAELIKVLRQNGSTRMRIIYNIKHCNTSGLKFGDTFLTSLAKLEFEAKASICSTVKENLLLYCRKCSAFITFVIIYHILITRSVAQKNIA